MERAGPALGAPPRAGYPWPMSTRQGERLLTCCFCSARSILPAARKDARAGRPLVCHGCGAPITVIAPLAAPPGRRKRDSKAKGAPLPHPADRQGHHRDHDRPARRKKGKRRKLGLADRLERFWDKLEDAVEDVIDEVFD
ncbi:MAG: hypothetical protein AAFV86_06435 [Pseudomonadota bacterium]